MKKSQIEKKKKFEKNYLRRKKKRKFFKEISLEKLIKINFDKILKRYLHYIYFEYDDFFSEPNNNRKVWT